MQISLAGQVIEEAFDPFKEPLRLRLVQTDLAAIERLFELTQQVFLCIAQVDRGLYHRLAQQVAFGTRTQRANPLASHAEHASGLGFRRNLQDHTTFEGWHFHFPAKGGRGKADRYLAIQVVAITLENRMFLNVHLNVQITCWRPGLAGLAFPCQTNTVTRTTPAGILTLSVLVFWKRPSP